MDGSVEVVREELPPVAGFEAGSGVYASVDRVRLRRAVEGLREIAAMRNVDEVPVEVRLDEEGAEWFETPHPAAERILREVGNG